MPKNEETREAVLAATETPLQGPNPLVIYGRNEKERAELLNLAAKVAAEAYSPEVVEYADIDELKNDYTMALLKGGGEHVERIEKRFEAALVAIFDNVQLLQPSNDVAKLVFQLFWELSENDCQIILGLDTAPEFTYFPWAHKFFLMQGAVFKTD